MHISVAYHEKKQQQKINLPHKHAQLLKIIIALKNMLPYQLHESLSFISSILASAGNYIIIYSCRCRASPGSSIPIAILIRGAEHCFAPAVKYRYRPCIYVPGTYIKYLIQSQGSSIGWGEYIGDR